MSIFEFESNVSDKISDTIKTTAGYFTNGDGTLSGDTVFTGSLADSNEKYYFNILDIFVGLETLSTFK